MYTAFNLTCLKNLLKNISCYERLVLIEIFILVTLKLLGLLGGYKIQQISARTNPLTLAKNAGLLNF